LQIHRIETKGTNCYLAGGQGGIVVIDPGPPGAAKSVIAAAKKVGIRASDVRLILVTHGHLDHYGAAAEVKTWCQAPIAAHPSEPEFSRSTRNALPPAQTLRGSIVRWFFLALAPLIDVPPLEADQYLESGSQLSGYGLEAQTIEIPGHSPGSLGVLTKEGDLFCGDLFVNFAGASEPLYLSDRAAWRQSLQQVQEQAPRTVYVGHGEPFAGHQLDSIRPARYQLRWWVR
jgi:glyoxylase-like metal-dependent hydrolase (beta-lactamase superfamily II)